MNFILFILTILISGTIGLILNIRQVYIPPLYWFIGTIFGFIAAIAFFEPFFRIN